MDQYTLKCPLSQLCHPPPFHPDQLRHAQAGCPDCLDHLVRTNEPLVHWVLRRLPGAGLPYDEALQAGRLALWKALLRFDPQRGFAFSSYAVVAIRRHVQLEARRFRRFWQAPPPLPAPPLPDPLEEVYRDLLVQAVPRWVAHLTPRRAYVLRAYYGLDSDPPQFQHAIAATLGVSRQRVQQLLQEARLLLALPVYSWDIRRLLERTTRQDVRTALQAWYRFCRQRRSP
jgi:RNA polymerase sporulation-specific sigma factor